MSQEFKSFNASDVKGLRPITPDDLNKKFTERTLLSSVTLPSQYSSYSICTEFAKEWFLEKFGDHYFNSVYVEGSHTFDEFRKFSDINAQLKHSNPLLAIIPTIDMSHNREWIDTNPELNMMMRRSRMEGTFFEDVRHNRGLHLQIQFKTILMQFTYKIRLDTKAEELDMMEFIKFKHRAGMTETRELSLDVHVPKRIISQIAFDNGIKMYDDGTPIDSSEMLKYLNSHSLIPFLYKLRCSTGNNEYFIKVPDCVAHIKSDFPNGDDGERQDMLMTNYNIDFGVTIEMTAPYCYTYYSQQEQNWIHKAAPIDPNKHYICIMQSAKTDVPTEDENHWKMITTEPVQYEVDETDLGTEIDIDFKEQFDRTDIERVIKYTLDMSLNPYLFMNFKVFNDAEECGYTFDWNNLIMHVNRKLTNQVLVIGIYCDNGYIMETIKHIDELDTNTSRTHI
jgi:hypothetical protein